MNQPNERKRYTPDMLSKARALYMEYKTAESISKATGIELSSVIYYTRTQWKPEREALVGKTSQVEAGGDRINLMVNSGMSYLDNALKSLVASEIPDPASMKAVADIILKLKQIKKMDEASGVVASEKIKPASAEEIKELFNKDPFASQTKPAEVT